MGLGDAQQLIHTCCYMPFQEPWTIEQRVFIYDTFVATGHSIVKTHRIFRNPFNVGRHGAVSSRQTILTWLINFRTRETVKLGAARGGDRTVRTPETVHLSSCFSYGPT